jgi:hypothetical protein
MRHEGEQANQQRQLNSTLPSPAREDIAIK